MDTNDSGRGRRTGKRVGGAVAVAFFAVGGAWWAGDRGVVHASPTCSATPVGDYCATSRCGPCAEGQGDCDPGQCEAGLVCVEEGATDRCRPASCSATPVGDFCASWRCGPCAEGEGDCDPGQCEAGLVCVEEGATDRCRPASCGTPGAGDYCASYSCGPCAEGEGDCDPGQCQAGLVCVEEGGTDHCRAIVVGEQLEVNLDGVWEAICCEGNWLGVSTQGCSWTESGRTLTDQSAGLKAFCPEGSPADCSCNGWGERMHGPYGDLRTLYQTNGGPVYPDYLEGTCVTVKDDGELTTEWTHANCLDFRLH